MYLSKLAAGTLLAVAFTSVNAQTSNSGNGLPICSSANSDGDGDGWGWENSRSCIVASGSAISAPATSNVDTSAGGSSHPVCSSSSFDPDGDGWGWENSRTCIAASGSAISPPVTTNVDTSVGGSSVPVCSSNSVDPDGDGWGWENDTSCIVGSNNTTTQASTDNSNGSENTNSADQTFVPVVAAANAGSVNGRPVCLTNASDPNNSGYGYENNQTCVVVAGVTATRSNPLLNQRVCEHWLEIPYGNFRLQNNVWNSSAVYSNNWSQCITLGGSAARPVASWDYNWLGRTEGNDFAVKSYPQVYYGRKTRYNQSGSVAETGLPAPVTSLPQFTVDFAYSETGNAERNVAFESFFHNSCEAEENNKQFEMMVWVGKPNIRTPGPIVASAQISGRGWDVHVNPSLGWGYVAFVAQNPITSGSLNWNAFVDWTRNSGPAFGVPTLGSNTCMGAIELGTETFWGAGTFTVDRLNVTRR